MFRLSTLGNQDGGSTERSSRNEQPLSGAGKRRRRSPKKVHRRAAETADAPSGEIQKNDRTKVGVVDYDVVRGRFRRIEQGGRSPIGERAPSRNETRKRANALDRGGESRSAHVARGASGDAGTRHGEISRTGGESRHGESNGSIVHESDEQGTGENHLGPRPQQYLC